MAGILGGSIQVEKYFDFVGGFSRSNIQTQHVPFLREKDAEQLPQLALDLEPHSLDHLHSLKLTSSHLNKIGRNCTQKVLSSSKHWFSGANKLADFVSGSVSLLHTFQNAETFHKSWPQENPWPISLDLLYYVKMLGQSEPNVVSQMGGIWWWWISW